ncbi:minor allergen Can f 2-like [Manis javanica]|uniref:minor allergen Can f 2-like n=1 Tax=Manis javanica TaxID=9974 RepID=UPI001879C22A|nr:minor allergen Can f 2-like [Manis javanica]XP_036864194.1 minor allergen Can f 2-like [Manis javanica]
MQLLLLTVGLALVCGLQAQGEDHEQKELDPQGDLVELSGRWHTVALASNDSALIRPSGRFRVFISRLDVEDGNLHGQILVPQDDQCSELSVTAFKTETAGEFTAEYSGQNHLYLAEMKPTEFMILYVINQYEGTTSLVAGLLVRNPAMRQRLLPVFESVCDGLGLHKDQVMVVEATSDCRRLED